MDVAEQALNALDLLAKRYGKTVLRHNGVPACLNVIDFLPMTMQLKALQVASNCCHACMTREEFQSHIEDQQLDVLTEKLDNQVR